MELALSRLEPRHWATVIRMEVSGELEKRLKDYGMVPGTRVNLCYRSPRGDVSAVEFRGAVLALRTRDLDKIRVRQG